MQIKPIFLIRFPSSENIPNAKFKKHYELVSEQLPDYNVIALIESGIDRVQFECYNAANATEKDIDELKAMALKILNQNEK
jgi:hypothetical protein